MTGNVYAFGPFTLDVVERRLVRAGRAIPLSPKAYDLLVALVRAAGRLASKEQLLASVWRDAFVEEGILAVHISTLRKALGDSARPSAYIETVPRSGYRFVAPVTQLAALSHAVARDISRPIEVYELVGRGRSHLLSGSFLQLPDAVAAFRGAIAIDPQYTAAHAGLALAHCAQAALRAVPHLEAYADAKTSALRALALDSASADAQAALGTVLFLSEWDWAAAERSFRRALDLNPAHIETLLQYGSLLEALGKLDEGLSLKQRALERDSQSSAVFGQIAWSYWHQRRYDDAISWVDKAVALEARHLLAGEFLVGVYWKLGDVDRMLDANLRHASLAGVPETGLDQLRRRCDEMRHVFRREGWTGLTRYTLAHMPPGNSGPVWIQRAVLYGAAGELDTAFDYLDRAIVARDPALVHLAVAPQWDSLRMDPRFRDRLQSMALPLPT